MVNRKILMGTLGIVGVGALTSLLLTGYALNKSAIRFQDYGKPPVSSATTDLIQAYFAAAVNGSKLLYLSSFTHSKPLNVALNINKKSNSTLFHNLGRMGYILIDDHYGTPFFNNPNESLGLQQVDQPIWSTNVASVQFRVDLGSFITGIAAGQFLNDNRNYFADDEDGRLTWATYGGGPYPTVTSFMGGFQRGIEWYNKNIASKNSGYIKLEKISLGSSPSQNFTPGFNPEDAKTIVPAFLEKSVDAIFPIAGPQIGEVARLVKQFNKRTIVIGVDSAVERDTNSNLYLPILPVDSKIGEGEFQNKIIQFSSVKNLDVLSNKVTQLINNPTLKQTQPEAFENIGGIGYSSLGDVQNGGAGVSVAGRQYFNKAMKLYATQNNLELDISNETTAYENATKILATLKDFQDLDLPENKYYMDQEKWNYSSIANKGSDMLPIYGTPEDRAKWYDNYAKLNPQYLPFKEENLDSIEKWVQKNKSAIDLRKSVKLGLVNKLTKENWEKNKSVIRIIFSSSTSILFDKSFLESCYNGLLSYWKTQGVNIPEPPK